MGKQIVMNLLVLVERELVEPPSYGIYFFMSLAPDVNANKQFEDYEIQGIPCTYYIDKKGKIIKREIGFAQGSEVAMEQLIVELIK